MVKVVKWDLRILWAVHSRHRRTKYSYNTRVCTYHPENEAQRTSGSTNPPKLAMNPGETMRKETWMTWHRQKATTVRTNGVLNNWYIYWYDDSMRIMGCFFLHSLARKFHSWKIASQQLGDHAACQFAHSMKLRAHVAYGLYDEDPQNK